MEKINLYIVCDDFVEVECGFNRLVEDYLPARLLDKAVIKHGMGHNITIGDIVYIKFIKKENVIKNLFDKINNIKIDMHTAINVLEFLDYAITFRNWYDNHKITIKRFCGEAKENLITIILSNGIDKIKSDKFKYNNMTYKHYRFIEDIICSYLLRNGCADEILEHLYSDSQLSGFIIKYVTKQINTDFKIDEKEETLNGKWIIDDLEFGRVWKCHCSICNEDPLDYVYGTENWWLCKTQMPKFCPSCGAVMREVE